MKYFQTTATLAFLVSATCLVVVVKYCGWDISQSYPKIQGSLFTGFLTIGGFLLTLKTFILVQLKKELFDNKEYQESVLRRQILERENGILNSKITLYGPLKNLGNYLLYGVISAIVTSVSHLTIGFISSPWAAGFCLAMSATTLALVLRAWWAIRSSLHTWFDLMDQKSKAGV